ncbi:septum formation family protein [Nocardioides zeae]|uniref:Septum formation family protein n=1 Tax=Nocardioides imazamoxiresistens TaxID=3231893 RepID=A0ABU3Q152_9ACTN|nr:septum formation family protein [Nocardioides zeae]MDT9595232.1 septum formation family protein [Nocardioides zeae]
MRPTARVRHAAAAAAAVLLLASACSSGDDDTVEPSPTSEPTAPPTASAAERPPADACYELTIDEALAPTSSSAPVDCADGAGSVTSVTYEVGALSTWVDGHLLAVDSAQVQGALASTCRRNLAAYLGTDQTTLRLSVVTPIWFSPTVEESDAGADWYRCDATAVIDSERLGALPVPLEGAFADGAGALALCGTAEPGAEDFRRIACGLDHAWRAVEVVDVGDAYPGEEAAQAAGQDQCQQAGREVAEDALDYQWGYEWPTAEQWAAGQTYGLCWVPA